MLNKKHKTVLILWVIFILTLIASLCAEFLMQHPHVVFGPEGILFFNAWFGFLSCVAIVLVSKVLGFVLKRKENYYDRKKQ